MVKITCADYGFECNFVIEVASQDMLEQFGTQWPKRMGSIIKKNL